MVRDAVKEADIGQNFESLTRHKRSLSFIPAGSRKSLKGGKQKSSFNKHIFESLLRKCAGLLTGS